MGGVFVGCIVFGWASDKFGRRPTMLCAIVTQICSTIICAFSVNYIMFIFFRFLIAFSVSGVFECGFVLGKSWDLSTKSYDYRKVNEFKSFFTNKIRSFIFSYWNLWLEIQNAIWNLDPVSLRNRSCFNAYDCLFRTIVVQPAIVYFSTLCTLVLILLVRILKLSNINHKMI